MTYRRGIDLLALAMVVAIAGTACGQGAPGAMSGMPGMAQTAPVCTAPAVPPPDLAGWQMPHRPIAAARSAADAGKALLVVGKPVDAALPQTALVNYAVPPAKPGGSGSYGGIFAFDVASGGHYRVAIGARSWIDLIENGAALDSIAHDHGPACTGIAKMVDYTLKPGRHLLQISAQSDPRIAIMVVSLP